MPLCIILDAVIRSKDLWTSNIVLLVICSSPLAVMTDILPGAVTLMLLVIVTIASDAACDSYYCI
jgi:hypothetical protein